MGSRERAVAGVARPQTGPGSSAYQLCDLEPEFVKRGVLGRRKSSRGLRWEGCGETWTCPHTASPAPWPLSLPQLLPRPLPAPKFLRDQSAFVTFPCPQTSPPAEGHKPTIRTLCGLAVVMAAAPGEAFRLRGLSSQLQPDPVWGELRPEPGLGRGQQPGPCPDTHPLRSPELAGQGREVRAKRPSEPWCGHWWEWRTGLIACCFPGQGILLGSLLAGFQAS